MIFKNFLLKTGTFVNKIKMISSISKANKSAILLNIYAIILKINNKPNLVKGCNLAIKDSVGI